jgi:hypothetical protein
VDKKAFGHGREQAAVSGKPRKIVMLNTGGTKALIDVPPEEQPRAVVWLETRMPQQQQESTRTKLADRGWNAIFTSSHKSEQGGLSGGIGIAVPAGHTVVAYPFTTCSHRLAHFAISWSNRRALHVFVVHRLDSTNDFRDACDRSMMDMLDQRVVGMRHFEYVVLGDWNASPEGNPFGMMCGAAGFVDAGEATHQAGGNLDYALIGRGMAPYVAGLQVEGEWLGSQGGFVVSLGFLGGRSGLGTSASFFFVQSREEGGGLPTRRPDRGQRGEPDQLGQAS